MTASSKTTLDEGTPAPFLSTRLKSTPYPSQVTFGLMYASAFALRTADTLPLLLGRSLFKCPAWHELRLRGKTVAGLPALRGLNMIVCVPACENSVPQALASGVVWEVVSQVCDAE